MEIPTRDRLPNFCKYQLEVKLRMTKELFFYIKTLRSCSQEQNMFWGKCLHDGFEQIQAKKKKSLL